MALTDVQTKELDIASQRVEQAKSTGADLSAFKTDIANIDYATEKLGYSYTPPAPTIKPETPEENVDAAAGQDSVLDTGPDNTVMKQFANASVNAGLTTTEQALFNASQQKQAETAQQKEVAEATQKESESALLGGFEMSETDKLIRDFQQQRALQSIQGISEKESRLQDIQAVLIRKKSLAEQEFIAIENKPILGSLIRGQKVVAERKLAAETSGLMAEAALLEGQISNAMDAINSYYDVSQVDRENQIEKLEKMKEFADDDLLELTKEESAQIEEQKKILEDANAREVKDRDKMVDLMTDPEIASVLPNINFSLLDTFEDTILAISEELGRLPQTKNTITSTDDQGRVRLIDKLTGEVIFTSPIGFGKSKQAPVSVTFPRQSQSGLFNADGVQIGFSIFNPITGRSEFTDFQGNSIQFPEGGRVGSISSQFNDDSSPTNNDLAG